MAQRNYDQELDALRDDLGTLKTDIERLLKSARDDLDSKSRETLDAARARGREGVAAAEAQIEQNPFASIAIAFGVGLAIGKVLSK